MKQTFKTLIALTILITGTVMAVSAQKANVTYVEGISKIKSAAGKLRAADFGGTVGYGESVITGKDGLVELTLENGSVIKVTQNSVFGYSSTGTGADTRQVLATTAGKISYKLNKATGKSPLIQTNSMVAGVRGTEFDVYAGRDGSVLLAVTGGIVDVESQGKLVTLVKDEAVEVDPGKAPGEKYVWLGKHKEFRDWNQGKMDDFYSDPVAGINQVAIQLETYKTALDALKKPYEATTAAWKKATEDYKKLVAIGDVEKIKAFQTEILVPAQDARSTVILNIRFYAMNYLSVRRYVLSNMYMEIKSRYPINPPDTAMRFFSIHADLLKKYETGITPELIASDF